MKMSGNQFINAPREKVWDALNDPEILSACISGCKSLEATENNGFEATVQAKVGPVKANFKGTVTLSDIDAPNGYTITGEGKGGAAGFAKGGAKVQLEDQDGGTNLSYDVDAKVGGKLAQIGSRLIDSTAKKMANDFFDKFAEQVAPQAENSEVENGTISSSTSQPAAVPNEVSSEENPDNDSPKGLSPLMWVTTVALISLGLIYAFS